ncbi:MAG: hypothetical protein D6722_06780, partial [Bacteroidetes bacterium]
MAPAWGAYPSHPGGGRPMLRNFRYADFQSATAQWALAQSEQGLIYSANGEGVLEFDGLRWRQLPWQQQGGFVRAMGLDQDRIYV